MSAIRRSPWNSICSTRRSRVGSGALVATLRFIHPSSSTVFCGSHRQRSRWAASSSDAMNAASSATPAVQPPWKRSDVR